MDSSDGKYNNREETTRRAMTIRKMERKAATKRENT